MKRSTTVRRAILLSAFGVFAAGCSSDRAVAPEQPAASASLNLLNTVTSTTTSVLTSVTGVQTVPVLTRNQPLASDIVVTQTIGPAGGVIAIPGADVAVTFAPNAVSAPTSITMTAWAGNYVAYGFEPHGLVFNAPVTLTQGLQNTPAYNNLLYKTTLLGGYIPDGLSDINSSGIATITESFSVVTTVESILGSLKLTSASFRLPHFSGYILSGGANSDME